MKNTLKASCISLIFLTVIVTTTPASATLIDTINGLTPGAAYRIVFVTSGARDARPTDISVYDSFVQSFADDPGTVWSSLGIPDTDWRAIASTDTVDAKDHVNALPSSPSLPVTIINPLGQLLATSYADFWDGVLQNGVGYNQLGNSILYSRVWTGTRTDGTGHSSKVLGGSLFSEGIVGYSSSINWIDGGEYGLSSAYRLYGISAELTARTVPEPSTFMLLGIGLLSMARINRKRVN